MSFLSSSDAKVALALVMVFITFCLVSMGIVFTLLSVQPDKSPTSPEATTVPEGLTSTPIESQTAIPTEELISTPTQVLANSLNLTLPLTPPPHNLWGLDQSVYVTNPNGTQLMDEITSNFGIQFDPTYVFLIKGAPEYDNATGTWWWYVCTQEGSSRYGIIDRGWVKEEDIATNYEPHILSC